MSTLRSAFRLFSSEPTWKLLSNRSWSVRSSLLTHRGLLQANPFHSSQVLEKQRIRKGKGDKMEILMNPKGKSKPKVIEIWRNMTVKELAEAMDRGVDHIFDVFVYVNNSAPYKNPKSVIHDFQVIMDATKRSGLRFKVVNHPSERQQEEVQKFKDAVKRPPADPANLVKRPPVVTIMGHVDHGKTTLLDTLRNTRVVDMEFGGITQHIGAFSVELEGSKEKITFLDTPGHAAFTAMRARGADSTDIVVLVVAADDGVMEQTIESIRMAKEAKVPMIVAINKVDKPQADVDRTRKMLLNQGIQLEEFGGDVQSVPVSALKGTNINTLVEAIALQAEIMDLKAEPTGYVEGTVIESKTDPGRGKLSTALVQRGTLRKGCILVAGNAWAKVRAMFDDAGRPLTEAPPSTPVEILGWRELPSAGDEIIEVESEKVAQEVMKFRAEQKQEQQKEDAKEIIAKKMEEHRKVYDTVLEERRKRGWFRMRRGPKEKEYKDEYTGPMVNIVVKGDVDGSVEALLDVIETYDEQEQCKLSLIHYGVGHISESDVEMAAAFNGIIYAFNVALLPKVKEFAKQKGVSIRHHNVIYKLVDDLKDEITKQLPTKQVEESVGVANVLQFFEINDGKKKVGVAGSRCTKGVLKKSSLARVSRGDEIVYEGSIFQLRHLKNEVDSIKKDVECGIRLDKIDIEFEPGDVIECYVMKDESQKCGWDPGF